MYQRIKDLREDADLSQRQIAEALSCSQQTYSNYETGARTIPPEILIKLAQLHNTSVDYLLGLTDRKAPFQKK